MRGPFLLLAILVTGCAAPAESPAAVLEPAASPEDEAATTHTAEGVTTVDAVGLCLPKVGDSRRCAGRAGYCDGVFDVVGEAADLVVEVRWSADGPQERTLNAYLIRDETRIAEANGPSPITLAVAEVPAGAYALRLWPDPPAGHVDVKAEWNATWTARGAAAAASARGEGDDC